MFWIVEMDGPGIDGKVDIFWMPSWWQHSWSTKIRLVLKEICLGVCCLGNMGIGLNMIFYVHWLASHFEINRSVRMELIQPALLSVDSWSDNLTESRMEHKICKQLPTVSQIGTPVRFRFTLNVLVAAHFLGKNHVTNWLSPRSCMMSPPNRWFIRNEI